MGAPALASTAGRPRTEVEHVARPLVLLVKLAHGATDAPGATAALGALMEPLRPLVPPACLVMGNSVASVPGAFGVTSVASV